MCVYRFLIFYLTKENIFWVGGSGKGMGVGVLHVFLSPPQTLQEVMGSALNFPEHAIKPDFLLSHVN